MSSQVVPVEDKPLKDAVVNEGTSNPPTNPCSPFTNELILEIIFTYLTNLQDLLSCRLVCLQWAILGSKILKTCHSPLIPVNVVGLYEDKVQFRIHDIIKLKESSLTFHSLKECFPYNRFKFGEYALDMGVPYINKFFNLFSPIMHVSFSQETLNNTQISTFREILIFHLPHCQSIELIFPRYGYLEFLWLFPQSLFNLLNPILPNITKLILRLPTDRTEFVPQFFKDLFRAVPNLVTFSIFGAHGSFMDFLLSKDVLLETTPLLKLQHLEIQFSEENRAEITQRNFNDMTEIARKYLKLKTLALSLMTDNIELRVQKEFISAVGSGPLTLLKINKFSYFESLQIPLGSTVGANLTHFETSTLNELQPLDFLFESLTNLKTLILGKVTGELFGLKNLVPKGLVEAYPPHPLQKLALPKGLLDSGVIHQILGVLYNLKRLELTADDDTLKSIWKCGRDSNKLVHFVELHLFDDSTVTDAGITGMSLSDCRDIYKNECELPVGVSSIEELRSDQPWIGNISGLRVFEMTAVDDQQVPKNRVSNVSIVYGFRFLLELNHLAIPKTWITNFSLYYIGKYYTPPLIFLNVNLCYWLTPPGLESLKDSRPHLQIKCRNWYKNLVSKFNRVENMAVPSSYYFMAF